MVSPSTVVAATMSASDSNFFAQRRMARLRHVVVDAGGDRMPRRRHNPKLKAAGVAPVPAAPRGWLLVQSSAAPRGPVLVQSSAAPRGRLLVQSSAAPPWFYYRQSRR